MFIINKMSKKRRFDVINNKPTNVKNKIIGVTFKLVRKVYISYIYKIIKKHNIKIEKKYSKDCFIIKNELNSFFIGYKRKFIDKKVISDKKEQKLFETIHKFLKIKFIDLLKFANFPFKNKNSSINIDEEIKEIIVEERKKINFYDYYKNKSGGITKIFLDELKPNKIKQRKKLSSENNNYYKQLVDYGDNELFTNLLDKNIYEIINILYFQDQKTNLESPNIKFTYNEKSPILRIPENYIDENENIKLPDFYVLNNKVLTVLQVANNENIKLFLNNKDNNNEIFDSDDKNQFIKENCREKSEKENKEDNFMYSKSPFNCDFFNLETKEETTDFFLDFTL